MKLLVCISKAPDTTTKITFVENNTKFNENGVQFIVNPYDEFYSLVRALELKEELGGTVTTITVGLTNNDPVIRKALAIGADDAVRIDAEPTDAYFVAKQIADYVKDKEYDIIFCGKETIDYNGSQVGGMIAEFLQLAYISLSNKLDVDGTTATIEREIQGGSEIIEVNTPFVISTAKGMAEQRIPNMRGIMSARTKPLNVVPPTEAEKLTEVKSYSLPPEKSGCKYIAPEKPEELVELLHNEAKVI